MLERTTAAKKFGSKKLRIVFARSIRNLTEETVGTILNPIYNRQQQYAYDSMWSKVAAKQKKMSLDAKQIGGCYQRERHFLTAGTK